MPRASTSYTTQLPLWRAGNPARSRLLGGLWPIRTRPRELLWHRSQTSLNWVLFYISPNPIKFRIGSDQTIEALLLPKRPMRTEKNIGLMSRKAFERPQPFGGKYMRRSQQMNMIRHDDESVEVVPVQFAVPVSQRPNHHLCNVASSKKQRASRARVQQPVDGYKRLTRRDESSRREYPTTGKTTVQSEGNKQALLDYVPMGQAPFVMPHTSSWCIGGRETLAALGRLKGGCGRDCPPSNLILMRCTK